MGIAIFLAGALLDFGRSDSIIFCFACAGLLSLLGGTGQDLVTNRFAEAGKVKGHGVLVLVGLDIVGGVAAAVVGIRVADTLGSTRGVFNYPHLILPLFCFSSLCPLRYYLWRFVPFEVMAYCAFQGRWGWGNEDQVTGPLVLSRSSSFWLKMGKGDNWKSKAWMKSVAWSSLFKCMDALHGPDCHLHIYGVFWQLALEISV